MLEKVKKSFLYILRYNVAFIKWIAISVVIGVLGGVLGSVFYHSIDWATKLRGHYGFLLYLLPVGGLTIAGMYRLFFKNGKMNTDRVIESVRKNSKVPFIMVPLIFVSTVITHGLGGSAGRGGAALQLGGGIGYKVGKIIRLQEKELHLIVMTGMSSVFAALYGTPLTATIFALEVTNVGIFHYGGLLPCVIASVTAFSISQMFHVQAVKFFHIAVEPVSVSLMAKVILLSVLLALVSILFCATMHWLARKMKEWFPNRYIRVVVGAVAIILLTLLVGNTDYNGAGMHVIERAIAGEARPEAFLLKILFTAITISAGFKGGEIVPSFFIGSTFGCVVGGLLGISPGFAASMGFVALFCGVVNCPLASFLLAIEAFGMEGMIFYAVVCAVSYMMSGSFGLYSSQRIVFSKLNDEEVNMHTR